jgi:hypothetical protein
MRIRIRSPILPHRSRQEQETRRMSPAMRIGIVFHKDPRGPAVGIDLVRVRAIARGLIRLGLDTEIVAPVSKEATIDGDLPVRPLEALREAGRYDLVKTSYHYSIELIGEYHGPVVSRIVRVVDGELPERDAPFRPRLLRCQEIIRERAAFLVLNNRENEDRWRRLYGDTPPVVLIPTGCPAEIPPPGKSPYKAGERAALFLGSLAAPRMASILNEASERLRGTCTVHLVGRNKTALYGPHGPCPLSPLITDHGELPEDRIWDYVRHARIGLAFATGPHRFDNDVSKVLNYLRGGLPVLSEEPIINNDLVRRTGHGRTFAHGDVNDLVRGAVELLERPRTDRREWVMEFMAREHSWDRRAEIYATLIRKIVGNRGP